MFHLDYDSFYTRVVDGNGEKGNNFKTEAQANKALLKYLRAGKRSVVWEWDKAISDIKKVLESEAFDKATT